MDSKTPKYLRPIENLLPKTLVAALPSLLQIGLLGIVFQLFNTWFRLLTELNPYDFNKSILAIEPKQYFEGSYWLLIPCLGIVLLMIWRRRLLLTKWNELHSGYSLRLILGVCTCLLTWAHITYPFDYFLEESAFLERALVFVIALLVIWRPYFVLVFLLFPILVHFGEPLLVNNWSIGELPTRVLILFGAQLLLWLAYPKSRWHITAFVFLLFCVIAGNYFPAGLGKIKLGWLFKNHIYLLLPNMYADGWLGFLDHETLSKITAFLSKYNLLLKIGCLVVEVGCLFILVRKYASVRFFLTAYLLFHTLVFVMTGICFWPWAIFELTLLYVLWKRESFKSIIRKFSVWHIVLSMMLIFTSSRWLRPSVYVWHDSPVNYTYSFEVEDATGGTSWLPAHFFWPKYYEYAWSNGFHFIHENPTLQINWGVSFDGTEIEKMLQTTDAKDILALEKEFGKSYFDPELAAEFRRYMTDFVKEDKYKLTLNPWFRAISAPQQRLVLPSTNETTYNGEQDILKINVYQKLSFFNEGQYQEVRKVKVFEIDIPEE